MKVLSRRRPAIAEIWQGDNYEEIKKFLCLEDNQIIRDGLSLIIDAKRGRKLEVPVGWYIIVEDAFTDSGIYDDEYITCVPPEIMSLIYETI